MVKEIVIHLGDCKTGTTSIQAVLAAGAWELPGGDAGGDIVYPARFNHIPLAKTLSVGDEKKFQTKRFAKVCRAFDESDATHGVISAEHFEFVDPALLKAAIEQHLPDYADRVRLVAYVRPHADRLVSTFAERSKKGSFMKSLEAMHDKLIADGLLFYTPRFEKWRAAFGDRFTLRPFVRDQLYQGDVVQDFFRHVVGGDGFTITRPSDQNNSLSVEDIAMMRALHRHLRKLGGDYRQLQHAFGWYMSDLLGAVPYPGGGTRPRLHKTLADQVVEVYREDAAALDAMFFEGTTMADALAAAPSKAVKKPQSFQARSHFAAPALRQIEVWAQLLHRMMAADPAHFAWAVRTPETRSVLPGSSLS
jgi:hypothetical protein